MVRNGTDSEYFIILKIKANFFHLTTEKLLFFGIPEQNSLEVAQLDTIDRNILEQEL
jgi:hypothetical protein